MNDFKQFIYRTGALRNDPRHQRTRHHCEDKAKQQTMINKSI